MTNAESNFMETNYSYRGVGEYIFEIKLKAIFYTASNVR
jgi:hypothetical protein